MKTPWRSPVWRSITKSAASGPTEMPHALPVDYELFNVALMLGEEPLWQREGDEIVRARQQLCPLCREPAFGPIAVARRAVPVAAGVIAIHLGVAVITPRQGTTEVRGSTPREIPEDSRLAGEQTVPDVGAIRRAVEADDLRHREHATSGPIRGRAGGRSAGRSAWPARPRSGACRSASCGRSGGRECPE
jgi:hypothetical protein